MGIMKARVVFFCFVFDLFLICFCLEGDWRRNCLHKHHKQGKDNYESIFESPYSAPHHTPMHPIQLVLHAMILKYLFFPLMPSSIS